MSIIVLMIPRIEQNESVNLRLLIFAIALVVSNLSLATNSNCRDEILVINTTDPKEFEEKLKGCPLATSAHLTLSERVQYDFEVLGEMQNLTFLSIDFPNSSPHQSLVFSSGNLPYFLDLQFLRRLSKLEFLAIQWRGSVLNQDVLNEMDQLIYARLPLSAFHPSLFHSKTSVVQYDFGDDHIFSFRLDGKSDQQALDTDSFEKFVNSARHRKFKRTASRINNNRNNYSWEINRIEDGDHSFFMDSSETDINWLFSFHSTGVKIGGTFNQVEGKSRLSCEAMLYSRVATISEKNELSLVYERKDNSGLTHFSEMLKVGFKDGQKNGRFIQVRDGITLFNENYLNGELTFAYKYIDSIPKLEFNYPLWHDMTYSYIPFKEFFFEDNEYKLIKGYSGRIDDSSTVLLLEIPFKEGRMDGTLVLRNVHGDTVIRADYIDGVLNGEYYRFSISQGDTIVNHDEYVDGVQHGVSSMQSARFVSQSMYDNGELLNYTLNYRPTGGKCQERILYRDKGYSESKFWKLNGELQKVQRHDLKGKLLSEKVHSLPDVDDTPPTP